MAKPITIAGSRLLIMLGDGNSPETFAAPCGLTTKGINFSANTNDFNVPDCADPDLPMWTERVIQSLSAGIDGNGLVDANSWDDWRTWFLSGLAKNIEVSVNEPLALGGGYFAMSAVLTGFHLTGNVGGKIEVALTIASDGEVTWHAAAS